METDLTPLGNPIALLAERFVYLCIGIFFIGALFTGIQRKQEKEE
tara:strand:+ start:488 stop:622 length:135 start_codon:yes stop_codon:yes gene_type:complete